MAELAGGLASPLFVQSNDLEEFMDQMADKYYKNADKTAERIFGKSDFLNPEYMLRLEKSEKKDDT